MYSVTSKATLDYLERIHPTLPVPPYGVNQRPQEFPERRPWCYGRQPDRVGVQGLRLRWERWMSPNRTLNYIPMSRYKLFLVGCTPVDSKKLSEVISHERSREILPGDVQSFLRDKSEICFLGEVTLDNLATIDNIVDTMLREMHELMRGAKQETDSEAKEPHVTIMGRLQEGCRDIINRLGRLISYPEPRREVSSPKRMHSDIRSSGSSN